MCLEKRGTEGSWQGRVFTAGREVASVRGLVPRRFQKPKSLPNQVSVLCCDAIIRVAANSWHKPLGYGSATLVHGTRLVG